MSMDYQAEDQAFHEEVAQEMKGMAFTSFTGNVYVDAIRTLKSRADDAYQRGQEDMRERAAALVRAIRNECPLADYLYRNGWLGSATYAEMRIRALSVVVDARSTVCQCGSAAKGLACKMDCPGSEVEP